MYALKKSCSKFSALPSMQLIIIFKSFKMKIQSFIWVALISLSITFSCSNEPLDEINIIETTSVEKAYIGFRYSKFTNSETACRFLIRDNDLGPEFYILLFIDDVNKI